MQKIPLEVSDHETLMSIYKSRLKFFIKVCLGAIVLAGYASYKGWYYSRKYDKGILSQGQTMFAVFFAEAIFFICLFIVYWNRVLMVKKDAGNGVKEIVYYKIIRKEHFEHTGQFFIALDNPDYPHYELDYETWGRLEVGDSWAIHRAPLSKYVFNSKGMFTII